jgi:hypothetical protein
VKAYKSELEALLREVRALETLAEEADIEGNRLEDYWDVSAELITLVTDIELQAAELPADLDDDDLVELQRRVRHVASCLAEISVE